VHAELIDGALQLWLVADADDRARPAKLFSARLDPHTGAWR
jgi:hypothetical protein